MAAVDYLNQVQKLYIAYFGRPADPAGLSYWANQVNAANGNMAVAIAGFAVSSESTNLFGGLPSAQKISAIYLNLFNRLPESTGLSYWMNQLDSGAITQAQAAWEIMNQAGAGDATSVANKLLMANVFTAQVDTAAEIAGYNGAQPAAYGRAYLAGVDATPGSVSVATTALNNSVADATGVRPTSPVVTTPGTPTPPTGDQVFTFTTVADSFTGGKGNDSFNGLIDTTTPANSTITAADKIEGGAGTDTLSITVTGSGNTSLPGLTISNVEKLSIRDQSTSGKLSSYDLFGTGITDVTSNVSTASSGLQFANLATGATLTVLGDKATQVANVQFSMANPGDTVSLVLDGGLQDTVAVGGLTTVTNTGGKATAASIISNGVANTLGVITLAADASDTITTLTLNANVDLTATLVATDYASTAALTVTGAGKVNLGSTVGFDGSTIDASANSGGLTIGLSKSVQTYKGSSGVDVVSGATPVSNSASIDGGAGIDILSAALINGTNGAAFKNFEVLDMTGVSSATLDFTQLSNSTITGVILNNQKSATATLNNVTETADGFTLTVLQGNAGAHTTLNFDSASVSGTNDVLNIIHNGNNAPTQVGALTAQGIETVKIAAGGVGSFNGVNLTDDSAKLISITGDQTYSLTVQAQGGALSQLTKIDASLTTGSVGITVNAATATNGQSALTVLGGSGVNTFDVATSGIVGSQGITITTGLGNDTVNVSRATLQNATDFTKLQFTTVTDLAPGDILNFGTTVSFQAPAVNVTGAADLRAALASAIGSGNGNTTGAVSWFQFGGDTYAVMNKTAGDGLTTDDIVVKLAGVVDLSAMQSNGSTLTMI